MGGAFDAANGGVVIAAAHTVPWWHFFSCCRQCVSSRSTLQIGMIERCCCKCKSGRWFEGTCTSYLHRQSNNPLGVYLEWGNRWLLQICSIAMEFWLIPRTQKGFNMWSPERWPFLPPGVTQIGHRWCNRGLCATTAKDSPCLKLRPCSKMPSSAGMLQIGVDTYGGGVVLGWPETLASWKTKHSGLNTAYIILNI